MNEERPLHVRVAEALGWTMARTEGRWKFWLAQRPGEDNLSAVPAYDTDWSATGQLIERHQIYLSNGFLWGEAAWHACNEASECLEYGHNGASAFGETPLVAACNYILALAKAGKLRAA